MDITDPLSAFRLDERVAVITGAGSGMGRSSALALAGAGAHVVVVDRDADAASAVAADIETAGRGTAEAVVLDVSDVAAIRDTVASVGEAHGRIDILFNHAGSVCAPGMEVTEEDWEKAVSVNLRAPVFITQEALPWMRKAERPGAFLYTASIAGLVSSPRSPIYAAMKGGVVQYMRSVAFALGPEGFRANAICPGPTQTPMLKGFFGAGPVPGHDRTDAQAAAAVEGFLEKVPLRRPGEPDEAGLLALYLVSDASSYITGAAIPFDGGYVAG